MIRRHLPRLLLASGLLAVWPAGVWADHLDRVKVCALFNSSGALAGTDEPAHHGVELADLELDTVELVGFDAISDLDRALELAGRCTDAQDADIGIGFSDSSFVQATAPLFEKAGVPFVAVASADPSLPARIGPNLFLAGFGADAQAQALALFARHQLALQRLALWTNHDSEAALALAGFFKAAFEGLGGSIAEEHQFGAEDNLATAADQLEQRLREEPQAIQGVFVASPATDAGPAAAAIRQVGLELPILGGDTFDNGEWDHADVSLIDDVYFASHAFPDPDSPLARHFLESYQQRYGRPPVSAFAALAYDALRLVADAAARAAPGEPTGLRDALAATRAFEGVTGTIDYSGGRQVPGKPVAIMRVERGTTSPVWVREPAD